MTKKARLWPSGEHLGSIHLLEEFPMPGLQIVSSLNLEHMGRSGDGTLLATSTDELLEDGVEVGEELLRRLAGEEGT